MVWDSPITDRAVAPTASISTCFAWTGVCTHRIANSGLHALPQEGTEASPFVWGRPRKLGAKSILDSFCS